MPDVLEEKEFKRVTDKPGSLSEGYIAEKDGETYILKQTFLKTEDARGTAEKGLRRDFVAEFVIGGVYSELPGYIGPDIGIVRGADGKSVFLSSKFFKDFDTLGKIAGPGTNPLGKEDEKHIKPHSEETKKVKGFEKVIAAAILCGDTDIHAENIGCIKQADGTYKAVKIDHGRAGVETPVSESELRKSLADKFAILGYSAMSFDVKEFRTAVKASASIDESKIAETIDHRIKALKEIGFEGASVSAYGTRETFGEMFDPSTKPLKPKRGQPAAIPKVMSEEEKAALQAGALAKIGEFYKDGFSKRREVLKELDKTLEVIEQIDHPSPEWKKGAWLSDLKGADPVEWAIEKGYKIGGKEPREWMAEREGAESSVELAKKMREGFVERRTSISTPIKVEDLSKSRGSANGLV